MLLQFSLSIQKQGLPEQLSFMQALLRYLIQIRQRADIDQNLIFSE